MVILALLLVCTGCGSSGANQNSGPAAGIGDTGPITPFFSAPSTPLQVRVGDDPSEQILSCDLDVEWIKLKSSTDPAVSVRLLPNESTIEFTRLAQTFEPIGLLDTTQGTYDQFEMKITGATVAYIDLFGRPRRQVVTTSLTSLVKLDRPVVIGDIPTILDIDVNLAKTVQLSPVTNQISLKGPVVTVAQNNIAGPGGAPSSMHRGASYAHSSGQLNTQTGAVDRLVGIASEVGDDEFTITVGTTELSLQVHFDGNSVFENVSPATLDGMLIEVEGWTQPDGSIYGNEIEGLSSKTGAEVEGFLVSASGSLKVIPQDAVGSGASHSLIGTQVGAILGTGVKYSVNSGEEDLTGLPLTFDAKHIFPGQRVEMDSSTGLVKIANVMQVQPHEVELLHQSLSGTVSNYTIGSTWMPEFDLILSANSHLAILNPGTRTVHVYQRSTTDMSSLTSDLQDGTSLTIRGFLFCGDSNDVASGTPLHFGLVASSMSEVQ
ncbi:MAG TPA: DUF5666 domain-containing protein [Terriglobales bacterium]|nr:DUF5666 domain-containing protein [Terriglobales bacterium]